MIIYEIFIKFIKATAKHLSFVYDFKGIPSYCESPLLFLFKNITLIIQIQMF